MKLVVVLLVLSLGVVTAQTATGGWSDWSDCSALCGGGVYTRTCPGGGCLGPSVSACNIEPCVNCTVTGFWMYSACSKPCGTGSAWMARTIIDKPTPGGTPCPALNVTYLCNTWMCYETINGYGYWFWGPFTGPGPLTFQFSVIDVPFDVFLFDQANFAQYQYDATRTVPYQTGYFPVRAELNVDNSKDGPIALDPSTQYYLVVDHTAIGAATGTANGDGTNSYNPNRFFYQIEGVEIGRGYSTDGTAMLQAMSGASSVAPTLFVTLTLLIASIIARW